MANLAPLELALPPPKKGGGGGGGPPKPGGGGGGGGADIVIAGRFTNRQQQKTSRVYINLSKNNYLGWKVTARCCMQNGGMWMMMGISATCDEAGQDTGFFTSLTGDGK